MTPVVAIVGRPNVGKSTLFNRLVGARQAIVHDQPGVTRDRLVGTAVLGEELECQVIDTGGLVPGYDPLGLGKQVLVAVEESDLLLLVVDGKEGLTTADERVWEALRPTGKPTILVVNKADTRAAQNGFGEFYRLGIGRQILLSAEHGTGTGELFEALRACLPAAAPEPPSDLPAVAIVGRPNVGKSSLLNRLAGEDRVLVSATPGTTRDPIDTVIVRGERRYLFVDTAGIRRRSQASGAPEELAVLFATRQIERAHVALLVVDAAQGITSGDLAIAGAIWQAGRPAVLAVNKWDLLDEDSRQRLDMSWPRLDELLANPHRANISSLSGRGVDKIFPALDKALATRHLSMGTGELNRIFEEAVRRHRPPALQGRNWKLFYATQVGSTPPTFMLFANRTLPRASPYRRYLENRLREHLQLEGVPIRLVIRQRMGKEP
jgi:GTP-binding protein